MADSADLVVLGAYFGDGKNAGKMSVFLMGCYDSKVSSQYVVHPTIGFRRVKSHVKMRLSGTRTISHTWLLHTVSSHLQTAPHNFTHAHTFTHNIASKQHPHSSHTLIPYHPTQHPNKHTTPSHALQVKKWKTVTKVGNGFDDATLDALQTQLVCFGVWD